MSTAYLSRPVLVWVVLGAILLGGGVLRVRNLGGPDFGVDEIFHVYPAQALMAGKGPALPSGLEYRRSLVFTRTVAWAGVLTGGVNERSARLPSALFGCLTIAVVFLIGRQWYSNTAGLVAAAVTAVAPMQVAFSRQVRMYALFQLLYLVIIYLIFQGIEGSPARTSNRADKITTWIQTLEVRPWLLLMAVPFVLLAWQTQQLIASALTGPAAYLACMAFVTPFMNDGSRGAVWKYSIASALLIIAGLTVWALDIGSIRAMYAYATNYAPTWAQPDVGHWRYYVYSFAGFYPTIFGTFLLTSVFALTRNWRATLYILACFTIPFLFHTFVFAWKEPRYLFDIMPLMFIVFGVGVSASVSVLYQSLTRWASQAVKLEPRVVAGTLTAAAVMFLFSATPELREGLKLHTLNSGRFADVQHFNWKKAMAFIGQHADAGDVVISSRTLISRYYGKELPLYHLNNQELESILREYPRDGTGRLIDWATDAPIILDVPMLEDVVKQHPSGWFVTEQPQFETPVSIPPDVARFIELWFHREAVPGAEDMVVFRWNQRVGSARVSIANRATARLIVLPPLVNRRDRKLLALAVPGTSQTISLTAF